MIRKALNGLAANDPLIGCEKPVAVFGGRAVVDLLKNFIEVADILISDLICNLCYR